MAENWKHGSWRLDAWVRSSGMGVECADTFAQGAWLTGAWNSTAFETCGAGAPRQSLIYQPPSILTGHLIGR